MFKRSSSIPQRNKFSLTKEEIINDIESIYMDDEQRSKLYYCLDETPPKEHRFEKIEEFLKGTQDLEKSSNTLDSMKNEMESVKQDIQQRLEALKKRVNIALNSGKS